MPDRMMDEFDHWALRLVSAFAAAVLLAVLLGAVLWWFQPSPARPERRQMTDEERTWVAKRHKYHGITISYSENGQDFFYRNGKKCRL